MFSELYSEAVKALSQFADDSIEPVAADLAEPMRPAEAVRSTLLSWGVQPKAINLLGVRNDLNPGKWNDSIFLESSGEVYRFESSVDPGRYYTANPLNNSGAANLILGPHFDLWKLGKHRSKYPALVQNKACTLWRDLNRNFRNDDGIIDRGHFGINLHHGGSTPGDIGRYSAGCQVVRRVEDFSVLYEACKNSGQKSFDYLLIRLEELPLSLRKMDFTRG